MVASYSYLKLLLIIRLILCFAVTVEHEHDKQNDIIVDSETDNEADNCSDQRDEKKVFDLEKTLGTYLCYHMHVRMIMVITMITI